jgi:probable F420-dependent oxidoreductase
MREYVQSIRAIFDRWQNGTPLEYIGEHYRFTRMQPFSSPSPIDHPDIPIHLAGIGPNMTALAGEQADGLVTHPTGVSIRFLREFTLPHLAEGEAREGRVGSGPTGITINPICATGPTDADVAREREVNRDMIAILFSTPQYWPSLDLHGWRELGERLHGMVREERWSELAAMVSDEMLDTYVPAAPYAGLGDALLERFEGIGGSITLPLPDDSKYDAEMEAVIQQLRGH